MRHKELSLACELSRQSNDTIYILDEPTTNHFDDVKMLLDVLNKISWKGNTCIVIECIILMLLTMLIIL